MQFVDLSKKITFAKKDYTNIKDNVKKGNLNNLLAQMLFLPEKSQKINTYYLIGLFCKIENLVEVIL